MNNIPLVPVDVEKLALTANAPGPVFSWALSLGHGYQVHVPQRKGKRVGGAGLRQAV